MMVLGIETSCDETAASVVLDGQRILSNVIYSQLVHQPYGGVVPELAARDHLNRIMPVAEEALSSAGVDYKLIDLIAATNKPGLAGALLVGYSFAQGLSYSLNKPVIPVNHVTGHLYAALLARSDFKLPMVVLAVSGGHTSLFFMNGDHKVFLLGQSLDDAAGEAFDKVAKMMGLGYPGGPAIEKNAAGTKLLSIRFPQALLEPDSLNFSFSGLKTAVLTYLLKKGKNYINSLTAGEISSICFAFQNAVFDVLTEKMKRASVKTGCQNMAVVGGVAANQALRERLMEFGGENNLDVFVPAGDLCTDNAAMIACCGYYHYKYFPQEKTEGKVSARAIWQRY